MLVRGSTARPTAQCRLALAAVLVIASLTLGGCAWPVRRPTATSTAQEGRSRVELMRLAAVRLRANTYPGFAAACARVARRWHETVWCPSLVPAMPRDASPAVYRASVLGLGARGAGMLITLETASVAFPYGHWALAEIDRRHLYVYRGLVQPRVGRVHRARYLGVHLASWNVDAHGMSLMSGHTLTTWQQRGIRFVVSLHGFHQHAAALRMAKAIVRQVATCRTTSTRPACRLVFRSSGRA